MPKRKSNAHERSSLPAPVKKNKVPVASLLSVLSERGLRITEARRAIANVLEGSRCAMSHADIEASLPEPIDRVTLYRTLDCFVEASVLTRIIDADRVSRFLPTHGDEHRRHAHFHCDDCSRIFCVGAVPPRRPGVPKGFAVKSVAVDLHGHCADCARDTH